MKKGKGIPAKPYVFEPYDSSLMSSEGQRVRSSKEQEVQEKKGKSDPP